MAERFARRLLLLAALATTACSPFADRDGPPRHERDSSTVPDAVPQPVARSRYGNPTFYEVFGQRYHVLPTSADFRERGVASWYGKKFHGERTASGETYDMYAMTAAHKTLPLPTYARVTNLRNGRNVVVKINDRGPFAHNRIIDLSYSAASRLDMLAAGTTLVEIEALEPGGVVEAPHIAIAEAADAAPAAEGRLYVQVGAFGDPGNAKRLRDKLVAAGVGNVVIREGASLYRVRVGPIPGVAEFDATVARMESMDIAGSRLVLE
ncbi:MAG TPA: septal ring lytic transglycosylase RlpA family protein [Gammaproteobacteria bacterium]|nr:septal ring lytic transglycosylase RlpA family protein [Gammaproteobacteria bacterium]